MFRVCGNSFQTDASYAICTAKKNLAAWNGILLPKLFWPTVRKFFSSDREKAEGREFAKFLKSLEQFIQTVKGQNNFW